MACRSNKVEHPTRDVALDSMKRLVYDNHVRGQGERSAGLNVYPCDDCGSWHIGHLPQTPSCYHYDVTTALDNILAADALLPGKPARIPRHAKRMLPGYLLAMMFDIEEKVSMMWFTWDDAWDFSCAPHPGTFMSFPPAECLLTGLLRIEVPAYVAKLRWSDYIQRNRTTRRGKANFTKKGDPGKWLATDSAVPLSAVRSIDVWYRGAWVNVADVNDDEYEAWLAESDDTLSRRVSC